MHELSDYKNFGGTAKAVIIAKFIALQAYLLRRIFSNTYPNISKK